ncbi:MAG: hypothetical protein ACRDWA_04735 [Acidimicrobiia bacterium]
MAPTSRNPRAEATSLVAPGHEARVLEPSPPSNNDPAWYADDPTDPSGATNALVTPIPGEGITWAAFAKGKPEISEFASSHWLGPYRRLKALPADYDRTRRALHQLAFFALAPKRHLINQKIGLRYTHGGFGTPFFGADEQVRIEGSLLVRQIGDEVRQTSVSTLTEACRFLEIPYRPAWFEGFSDPPSPIDPGSRLVLANDAVSAIGEWFGFATSVLEQLRRMPGAMEVSRVQLWPEHFDLAIEMGPAPGRASYGASPGDDHHPEPYLYVSAWEPIDRADPFWNDQSFNGASLPCSAILAAPDQRDLALEFFHRGYHLLVSRI